MPPLTLAGARRVPRAARSTLRSARVTGAGGIDLDRLRPHPASPARASTPGCRGTRAAGARQPVPRPSADRRRRASCGSTPPPAARSPRRSSRGTVSLAGGTFIDPADQPAPAATSASTRGLDGNAAMLRSFRADGRHRRHDHRRGPRHARRAGLPGRPPRPAQRRALHRRRLRQHPDHRRARGQRAAGRRRRHALGHHRPRQTEISVAEGLGASAQAALDDRSRTSRPPRPVQVTLDRAQASARRALRAERGRRRHRPRRPASARRTRSSCAAAASTSSSAASCGSAARPPTSSRSASSTCAAAGCCSSASASSSTRARCSSSATSTRSSTSSPRTQSGDVTAIVTVDGPRLGAGDRLLLRAAAAAGRGAGAGALQPDDADLSAVPARPARRRGGRARRRRRRPGICSASCAARPASTTSTSSPRTTARPRCAPASTSTSNIYLDVQTDTDGVSRAEINLEVSDSVTARGSVGSDGNTILGIFYERDYLNSRGDCSGIRELTGRRADCPAPRLDLTT